MMAKEYIDRIDKLNLFYLSFYVKNVFQWRQTEIYNKTWTFPISYSTFLTACLLGFVIEGIGRQSYRYSSSNISYSSELRGAAHSGTISLGY